MLLGNDSSFFLSKILQRHVILMLNYPQIHLPKTPWLISEGRYNLKEIINPWPIVI